MKKGKIKQNKAYEKPKSKNKLRKKADFVFCLKNPNLYKTQILAFIKVVEKIIPNNFLNWRLVQKR